MYGWIGHINYDTCAPKYASSAASSNVKYGTGSACGYILGSHVKTPSTSFHTYSRFFLKNY
jgi:hypothetical protein